MTDTEPAASYTEAHPVAEQYECLPCGATLSGDNVTPFLADLFTRAHASCPAEEVTD